jgi:superfamily I DNA/RNA helicase
MRDRANEYRTMTPSKLQQAIFDFIPANTTNLIVNAVAGSGKTTTAVGIVNRMPASVRQFTRFMAFSKAIATELSTRLPVGTEASTLHSFGYRTCKRAQGYVPKTDVYKYRNYAERLLLESGYPDTEAKQLSGIADDAINMVRLTLTDVQDGESWDAMLNHYDIQEFPELREITLRAISMGIDRRWQDMDFTDMLWLPVKLGYAFENVDTLIVDECQDLNNLQREFIRNVLGASGRLIAVGDPYQAIFGFAGATVDSVDRIRTEFDCATLPLSVCYRCPVTHLDMAREFVSHILARDNASSGTILHSKNFDAGMGAMLPGDLVMCRNNAPLVGLAFGLISQGKPVTLRDQDLVKQITNLAQRAVKGPGRSWSNLLDSLDGYVEQECAKLRQRKGTDGRISALLDRTEALRIIAGNARSEGYYIASGRDLDTYISRFMGDAKGSVKLSTIHRAKGLEATRTHILGYGDLQPAKYATAEWEKVQETNLQYVALTRAREFMQFVPMPPRD